MIDIPDSVYIMEAHVMTVLYYVNIRLKSFVWVFCELCFADSNISVTSVAILSK